MAGFFVSDGPYKNSRAPNPSCCSDPGILCPACARLALGMPREALFSLTANADADAADVAAMTPPTFSVKCRCHEEAEADDDLLANVDADVRDMIPPSWFSK